MFMRSGGLVKQLVQERSGGLVKQHVHERSGGLVKQHVHERSGGLVKQHVHERSGGLVKQHVRERSGGLVKLDLKFCVIYCCVDYEFCHTLVRGGSRFQGGGGGLRLSSNMTPIRTGNFILPRMPVVPCCPPSPFLSG